MDRTLSRFYFLARMLASYGLVGGSRIAWSLVRRRPVAFSNRGKTYLIPGGKSALYHLVESIDKLRRLAEYVRPEDRAIVDVGAHAGLFTAFALERAPGATAILAEPQPEMRPVIERNLRDRTRWRLEPVAVSDRAGSATFHRAESSQLSTLEASTIHHSRSEPITVRTVTLDDLCAGVDSIDVLKVDVQGAEHLVLAGGRATLARTRTLLIEVSFADPEPRRVLEELEAIFGPGVMINPVHAGADLLFERA